MTLHLLSPIRYLFLIPYDYFYIPTLQMQKGIKIYLKKTVQKRNSMVLNLKTLTLWLLDMSGLEENAIKLLVVKFIGTDT